AGSRRSGGAVGHADDYSKAGGGLQRIGGGKTGVNHFPFWSRLMRLTMSVAARSSDLALESLGSSNTDQMTCLLLASTKKTMPLPRPKEDVEPGLESLLTVSVISEAADSSSAFAAFSSFSGLAGFTGSGGGYSSSSLASKP